MCVVVRGWMTPRIALRLRNRADPGLVSVRGLERPGSQRNTKGLVMSIKLTETLQLLLSAASKRDDSVSREETTGFRFQTEHWCAAGRLRTSAQ